MIFQKFFSPTLRDEDDGGVGGGEGADTAVLDPETDTNYSAGAQAALEADRASTAARQAAEGTQDGQQPPADNKSGKGKEAAKVDDKGAPKFADSLSDVAKGKKAEEAPDEKKAAEGQPTELPEDKLQLGAKAGTETTKQFGELKGITKGLRTELSTAQAKIKELETKGAASAPSAELEQLRQQNKQLSDRLAVVDLRNHPKFQQDFVAPKTKTTAALTEILKDSGVDGVDLASLVSKPRQEFSKAAGEVIAKLPEFERAEFAAGLRTLRGLQEGENAALANASEGAKNLGALSKQQQTEAFNGVWAGWGDKIAFQEIQATEQASDEDRAAVAKYNAAIPEIRGRAEKYAFQTGDVKEVSSIATKAATYDFWMEHAVPRLEAEYKRAVSLVRAQHAELVALRGAKAEGQAAGGGGSGGDGGGDPNADIDYRQEAKKYLAR